MRTIRRAAPDAEEEQPSAAGAKRREMFRETIDGRGIERLQNARGLVQMLACVAHDVFSAADRYARVSVDPTGAPKGC
jgi:hypothetical protein